jgi:hypothetical protein
MSFLTSAIVGVIAALVTNYLIQRWQARNWLTQQRLLGHEKKYINMATLFSDISDTASRRLTEMFRLVDSLDFDEDDRVKKRLEDYDAALKSWNEKLNGIFVRLTALMGHSEARRLEQEVHASFRQAGTKLEALTRLRLKGSKISRAERSKVKVELDHIQGLLRNFNYDFLNIIELEHTDIFYGRFVDFNATNLETFSNWELFKALFQKRVERPRIFRAPLDLPAPAGNRD